MKLRWRKELMVEMTAAEVIEACREYLVGSRGLIGGRDSNLLTADGFDDHDRTFSLTFEVKE